MTNCFLIFVSSMTCKENVTKNLYHDTNGFGFLLILVHITGNIFLNEFLFQGFVVKTFFFLKLYFCVEPAHCTLKNTLKVGI